MLDDKKKARLNEVGKEIAGMCPKDNGSVTFDYGMGRLKGVRFDAMWRLPSRADYQSVRK